MAPFAGMKDHAKWLLEKDIISLLEFHGFTEIEITARRDERNGKRILLYAHKQNDHNL
jgi:tRNA (mo5U34)-methyltransferase